MLQFNPKKRISVDGALEHPFYKVAAQPRCLDFTFVSCMTHEDNLYSNYSLIQDIRKKKHEIVCDEKFDFSFESKLKTEADLKAEFREEAKYWN